MRQPTQKQTLIEESPVKWDPHFIAIKFVKLMDIESLKFAQTKLEKGKRSAVIIKVHLLPTHFLVLR